MHSLLQLGPPQLFEQEVSATGGQSAFPWIISALLVVGFAALLWRRPWRMRVSDDRLAFVLMSRRLGVRRSHRDAIERLAERSGTEPIGLLMCESAFARAAAGERFGAAAVTERKPVLLTGAELSELGGACEQLFGPGAIDRLQSDAGSEPGEEEPSDAEAQRSQWVA